MIWLFKETYKTLCIKSFVYTILISVAFILNKIMEHRMDEVKNLEEYLDIIDGYDPEYLNLPFVLKRGKKI